MYIHVQLYIGTDIVYFSGDSGDFSGVFGNSGSEFGDFIDTGKSCCKIINK